MTKTQNYNLNKPESADPMRVSDFNENADKIDAALKALNTSVTDLSAERIYIGSYVGNGKNNRTIQLPWEPKFAIIMGHYSNRTLLCFLSKEFDYYDTDGNWTSNPTGNTKISEDTFLIQNYNYNNISEKTVTYVLFR